MSTLDNINENIQYKIDIIDKIINNIKNDLKIELFDSSEEPINFNFNKSNNLFNNLLIEIPLSLNQNLKIFNKRYNVYLYKKYIYEVQSIIFLTEYYRLDSLNNTQPITNNIYNDNIFYFLLIILY